MDDFWDQTLFTIHETPVSAVNLLTCLFIVILSFALAKGVRGFVMRMTALKEHVNGATLYGIGRLSYYIILLIGIYIALTTIGIDLTGVAVVIGALSVGIGFGLQSIFNNFVAGIIVLLEKKIRIHDRIQLESGDLGIVSEINVRSTVIRTHDNRKILIPNTEIVSKRVIHWSQERNPLFRMRIPFSVERTVEKEEVKQIALEALQTLPQTSEKIPPDLWLTKLSETLQEFELVVWVSTHDIELSSQSLSGSYLWALENAFKQKGIKLQQASRILLHSSPLHEL
ncbi:MAG: mechanosensitive ion channel [Chlamydiia bacterium]|nr:mechanosensitive ion channel [Chlamydiia bacterium]